MLHLQFEQDPESASNTGADPGSGIPTTAAATAAEPPPQTGMTFNETDGAGEKLISPT